MQATTATVCLCVQCPAMCKRHSFSLVFQTSGSNNLSTCLFWGSPQDLGIQETEYVPIYGWTLHIHIFTVLWLVMSFWVNHVHCSRIFLWWGLRMALICSNRYLDLDGSFMPLPKFLSTPRGEACIVWKPTNSYIISPTLTLLQKTHPKYLTPIYEIEALDRWT